LRNEGQSPKKLAGDSGVSIILCAAVSRDWTVEIRADILYPIGVVKEAAGKEQLRMAPSWGGVHRK
jgi:hypothetical protein